MSNIAYVLLNDGTAEEVELTGRSYTKEISGVKRVEIKRKRFLFFWHTEFILESLLISNMEG